VSEAFDDLLAANQTYQQGFELGDLQAVARAGVAMVTCMDSRIDPLAIVGLRPGDAKVFRNPGGRVTPAALTAIVLGVHLLGVRRVMVVPHTRCAMATDEQDLLRRLNERAGVDASWLPLGAAPDQELALREDVAKVRAHPLVPDRVQVGGFLYDVETGALRPMG